MPKRKKAIDVGDAAQVAKFQSKLELAREREVHELKQILATVGGRAFVWRLLIQCKSGVFIHTHPQETFRQVGQQDVGTWLMNEVFTSDPDAYTLMWREAQERERDA